MLTFGKIRHLKGVVKYASRDNYYTEEESLSYSQWHGMGAPILGLEGRVTPDRLSELLDGKMGEQLLGRWQGGKRKHRPGYELTFSAPKSVSILSEVYGCAAVGEAHRKAVRSALDYVESRLLTTRTTQNNVTYTVPAQKVVFALFEHDVSRELDPQLHTHSLLMNATYSGHHWQSIQVDKVYRDPNYLGAVYRQELAVNLQSLGYRLNRNERDPTLFEIDGVPPELMDVFSKRSQQIAQYFKDKNIEYSPKLAKRIALLTRRSKETLQIFDSKE